MYKFKRRHHRAPVFSTILFIDSGYVLKARTDNISEGGLLASELPHYLQSECFHLMFNLPRFPNFAETFDVIKDLRGRPYYLEGDVIRAEAKSVRQVKTPGIVEQVFILQEGWEFKKISTEDREKIASYVNISRKNLHFLLDLYNAGIPGQDELILHIAKILGYGIADLSALRLKLTHHLQSLESL